MYGLKKFLRLLGLVCFILLASIGLGIGVSFHRREQYMDDEINIEQVIEKEDEQETELKEQK